MIFYTYPRKKTISIIYTLILKSVYLAQIYRTSNDFLFILDCGTEFALDNGYVNFTGRETTYNKSVEVTCDKGYDNDGTNEIVCLQTGQWSDAMCRIKGKCVLLDSVINFQPIILWVFLMETTKKIENRGCELIVLHKR